MAVTIFHSETGGTQRNRGIGRRGGRGTAARLPPASSLLCIGAAMLAVFVASVLVAGPASGGSARREGTSCASYVGPFPEGPFSLSGCSDVANTGGSGSLDNRTGVITWATGHTTSVTYTLTPVKKDEREKHGCPPTSAAEFKLRGMVTADNTGSIEVGGPVTGEVCGRENGVLVNEKGTRLKIV
jgi:hypothetical protein